MKKYFEGPTEPAHGPLSTSTIAPIPNIRVRKVQQCGYYSACRSPYAHSYPHNGYKWEKWTQKNCLIGIFYFVFIFGKVGNIFFRNVQVTVLV